MAAWANAVSFALLIARFRDAWINDDLVIDMAVVRRIA